MPGSLALGFEHRGVAAPAARVRARVEVCALDDSRLLAPVCYAACAVPQASASAVEKLEQALAEASASREEQAQALEVWP